MHETIEDFDDMENLGHGFLSANPLEDGEKEYIISYLSHRFLDTETRYVFIENLCLSLYYTCTNFRHYLLSSICVQT
jgi:hypothetical protein